ncbi:hypothetical protein A2282_02605 [candidate division WOR-1 bacterium RIFOXYA12_FULL_36_13]|nr:MAG: hypothetical protein A2282_02605 [candidate division WOR-1 bacterium RIFOXYA12_FULL_36_13]
MKTRASLISIGTELTILSGEFPPNSSWSAYGVFPFDAGYCAIGEVMEAGPDADKELVGKKVATWGVHSLYNTLPGKILYPINRKVADDESVFFAIALIVMNGVRMGNVVWGESVVIYGMGLLGQFAARLARIAGARPVFCVDVSDERLALLPDDPALIKINPKKDDVLETVKAKNSGRKADVVIELTGNQDLIPSEFAALKDQGRFVVLSSPRGPTKFDFHDLCNAHSYNIIGAHTGAAPQVETPYNQWTRARSAELYFNQLADGELNIKNMVSKKVSYKDAPQAYYDLLKDRSKTMGVIIEWK